MSMSSISFISFMLFLLLALALEASVAVHVDLPPEDVDALKRQRGSAHLHNTFFKNTKRSGVRQGDRGETQGMTLKACNKQYYQLIEDATDFKEKMDGFVRQVAFETGGNAVCAPMKSRERACEKILGDYKNSLEIKDLVRCSIVYETADDLCKGANAMPSVKTKYGQLNDPECGRRLSRSGGKDVNCIGAVKLKNRFTTPQGGYADILMNLVFQTDNMLGSWDSWQVGELQLHLAPMIVAKELSSASLFSPNANRIVEELQRMWATAYHSKPFQGGHHYYEVSRSKQTDEATKQEAERDGEALYSMALSVAGCKDGIGGDAKDQIEQSPSCACLMSIDEETFNMNLQGLLVSMK